MMKLKNETHIEGLLYEHKLEKRVSGVDILKCVQYK